LQANSAKSAESLFPFLFHACAGGSQFPLRRWVKSEATEGVDSFHFSPFRFHFSVRHRLRNPSPTAPAVATKSATNSVDSIPV
jgi:hypothetical protein